MTDFAYHGHSILSHPKPTDRELYELMLIGLRFQRIPPPGSSASKILLGNMGNGVLIALEWIKVLTKADREALHTRASLVGLVYTNCEVVRHEGRFDRRLQRQNIREVSKDIFMPLPERQMFAHGLLLAPQGYRLFITDAGVRRVDEELRPKYPLLTPDVFAIGWAHYRRQVRHTGMHHARVSRIDAAGGVAE